MQRIPSITDQAMPVALAFDTVALGYDATWSDGVVGRLQRQQVWRELGSVFRAGDRVLELGCGTGVDAVHLAREGVRVHAIDVSKEMLRTARMRIEEAHLSHMVTLELRAVESLPELEDPGPFDGVLSDFGVLNCVRDLRSVASNLAPLLRPGGRLVVCLMGRLCIWETAWHLLRGRLRKALRRFRAGEAGIEACLGSGPPFRVSYPRMRELARAFQADFAFTSYRSIGLLVPPSFMEPWAGARRGVLDRLASLETRLGGWPLLRGMGDHRLAVLTRNKPGAETRARFRVCTRITTACIRVRRRRRQRPLF